MFASQHLQTACFSFVIACNVSDFIVIGQLWKPIMRTYLLYRDRKNMSETSDLAPDSSTSTDDVDVLDVPLEVM